MNECLAYVVTIIHLSGDFDQLISSKPSLRTAKKIGEQNPDWVYDGDYCLSVAMRSSISLASQNLWFKVSKIGEQNHINRTNYLFIM